MHKRLAHTRGILTCSHGASAAPAASSAQERCTLSKPCTSKPAGVPHPVQWLRSPTATQPSTGVVTGAAVCERWRHTKRMMAPERASLSLSCCTPLPRRSCQHQAAVRLQWVKAVDATSCVAGRLCQAQLVVELRASVSTCIAGHMLGSAIRQAPMHGAK